MNSWLDALMMVVSLKPFKVRALETGACRECLHALLISCSHPPFMFIVYFMTSALPHPLRYLPRWTVRWQRELWASLTHSGCSNSKRSRWSLCWGPSPSMTCKSLLISVQGIEVLDLIFLAAKKKKSTSQELPLCVCMCVCVSAAQCFLLAFLTGSWCWVQLRTGKRPFLSSVNHLRQREKK